MNKYITLLLVGLLGLSACSTQLAPKSDPFDSAVTSIESLAYDVVQAIVPNPELTKIATALPAYPDTLELGGFFAPRPDEPNKTCTAPDWYVLAGTSSPLANVVLTDCVVVSGTVRLVEKDGPWWHSTFWIIPDQTGLLNQFSNQDVPGTLKVMQAHGFNLPKVGDHVVAHGVWVIDLNWGFSAILNGEGQAW